MNELILKRLAEQATTKESYYPAGCNGYPEYRYDFDKEKFAELFIRECANVAKLTEADDGNDYKSGRHWAGTDILKHFGVKE